MARDSKTEARSAPFIGSAIADALFGATQQTVLSLLFGQPDRSFFTTQIMELANAGRGAVQRELSRLAGSGLVTVTRLGNQKHYQANPDSPLFEELCSIVQKTSGLQGPLRAALEPLGEKIRVAVLYGSIARRTDTASSDIDLLIVSDLLSLEAVISAFLPVEKLLDRRVSCTLYTQREFDERLRNKNPFLTRVLAGPRVVLAGSLDGE